MFIVAQYIDAFGPSPQLIKGFEVLGRGSRAEAAPLSTKALLCPAHRPSLIAIGIIRFIIQMRQPEPC